MFFSRQNMFKNYFSQNYSHTKYNIMIVLKRLHFFESYKKVIFIVGMLSGGSLVKLLTIDNEHIILK